MTQETTDWRQRAIDAEEALRDLLAVLPVLPEPAKTIVGMEARYVGAVKTAKTVLRDAR